LYISPLTASTSFPSRLKRGCSDCEVILPLYQKMGVGLFEKISGIFAFALYDIEKEGLDRGADPFEGFQLRGHVELLVAVPADVERDDADRAR